MVKKTLYWVFPALVLLTAFCGGSKQGLQNISQGEGSTDSEEEGFVGEDKLLVKGDGVSPAGLTTQLQKEAAAKEAARMDAQRKVIEICRGANIQAAATVDNFALAGSAVGKDLVGRLKGAKVKKANCKPDGDRVGCKVLMEIYKKGIKKECEMAMAELAK
ncbi:MAG: hypothetical protein NZL89_02395 [Leptospiraceae bacterium]|nr:hypothetical protein [Leptospiraceae bacterium]